MSDNVIVVHDLETVAVVDSTAALVHVEASENNIAVIEVQLQNQVVIDDGQYTVTVIANNKGDKGDKGDAADLDPAIINPIIDGRITLLTDSVTEINTKIQQAINDQNTLWNTALNNAKAEIGSNLVDGLNTLDTALDAAKVEYNAAYALVDAKYKGITDTINAELDALDTDLTNLKFETDAFNYNFNTVNNALNTTITDYAQFKTLTNGLIGEIRNAVFIVNPSTGEVTIAAYSYTDTKLNQANIRMDGIDGTIDLTNQNLLVEQGRITNSIGRISLLESKIELKVNYTQLNEAIAGAISAVTPAYSFGFFNSTEGWSAVQGSITNTVNKVSLVHGDITNQSLSYSADDNPIISLTMTRTAGTGWDGTLYVTYSGGSVVPYTGVILDVPIGSPFTRTLNLSAEPSYAGTVTGIRIKLGQSASDTFDIDDITLGKPSAAVTQLEGIQGQINDLGVELDGVAGSLSNYVTTTYFNNNAVTLNNVNTVLDGANAIISLKATQTLLNSNNTITKANSASTWVDAANGNITNVITTFNAQPNGIDSKLGTLTGNYSTLRTEMDSVKGTISNQIVSIDGLKIGVDDVNKANIYAQLKIKQVQDNALAIGDSVSVAQQQLTALSNETRAFAQSVTVLNASYGSSIGQLNSSYTNLNKVVSDNQSANALEITRINANLAGIENTVDANYDSLTQAVADANSARVTLGTSLTAKINNDVTTLNNTLREVIADETEARVLATNQLNASFTEDITALSFDFNQIVTNKDNATNTRITSMETNFNNNLATKLEVTTAIANERATSIQEVAQINATLGANYATISSLNSAITNQNSSLTTYVDSKTAVYDARYANIARVDLVESKVDSNRASTETAVFAVKKKNKGNEKAIIKAFLDLDKQKVRLLEDGELAAIGQRQIAVELSTRALVEEKANLTAAIGRSTDDATSKFEQVNKALATETVNRVSALTQLSATVNGSVQALITDLSALEVDITGVTSTISGVVQQIEHPTNGLSAISRDVNSLTTTVNGNITATNQIKSTIEHPTTGLAATYHLVQTATVDIDGITESIGQLSTQVTTNGSNISQAMVNLQSVNNSVGQLFSRATLAVLNTINGKTTINGIIVDGGTNTILLQAGAFGLVNLQGEQQLYWNQTDERWQFSGDLIAGTYKTSLTGLRVEASNQGSYLLWIGDGVKNDANALFSVDTAGNIRGKNLQLKNPKVEMIGSTHMRVEAAEAFGPHNLISWFGAKINGVNYNSTTNEIITSGLLKSNAITYLSSAGDAYFGGTFQAGTLSSSGTSTLAATNVTREIEFTSNGDPIAVAVSYAYSAFALGPESGDITSVKCPVDRLFAVPRGTLYLENWNGSAWVILQQWAIVGTSSCQDGVWDPEIGGGGNTPYDESALASVSGTYTDQSGVSGVRKMRVRLQMTSVTFGYGASQSISIATTE